MTSDHEGIPARLWRGVRPGWSPRTIIDFPVDTQHCIGLKDVCRVILIVQRDADPDELATVVAYKVGGREICDAIPFGGNVDRRTNIEAVACKSVRARLIMEESDYRAMRHTSIMGMTPPRPDGVRHV